MSTDFSLIVRLAAQTGDFEAAMKQSADDAKRMAKAQKDLFEQIQGPAKQYAADINAVKTAYANGLIGMQQYAERIDALRAQYDGTAAASQRLRDAGQRVFREMMTPLEQYRERLAELDNLLRQGAISQETFNRARAAATTQLSNTGPQGEANARATAIFNATRTAAERYNSTIRELDGLLRVGAISQDTYNRAVQQAQAALQPANQLAQSLSSSLLGFSTVTGGVVAGTMLAVRAIDSLADAAKNAAFQGIKLAAEFEQAEIAFGTVYKSAELAKKAMVDIQQFAAATPFEFPELKDAAVKLAGFGTSADQLIPTLKMLGDIAAGTGTTVGELAETYGKARVQGRAYTRDVNEFANRGVPIWEALAKTFGVSQQKIHDLVEEGAVGFPELQRALQSLTEGTGLYAGAVERQSQSLNGLYSTLRDNVNLALAGIAESIATELSFKDVTKEAIEFTSIVKNELSPTIIELAKGMAMLSAGTGPLLRVMSGIDTFKASIQGANEAMLRWKIIASSLFAGGAATEEVTKLALQFSELQKLREQATGKVGKLKIEQGGNKAAEELSASITEFNKKLKEQIETFGQSADEIELYRLKQQGATDEMLRQTRAMLDQKNAQKELADAQKKAADEQERAAKRQADAEKQLIKSLQDRLAALKGMQEENKLVRHATEFGQENVPEEAKRLAREIEAAEALKKKQKEIDDQRKKDAEDAKRIIEASKTPYEKYLEEGNRIIDLYKKGLLTREQAKRAADQLDKEFAEGGKKVEQTSENKALLRGTAEAFSAVNRINDKRKMEKIAEDQLTVMERQELLQRLQLQATKNVQRWN